MDANERQIVANIGLEDYRQAVYAVARQARIAERLRSQHRDTEQAEELLVRYKRMAEAARLNLGLVQGTRGSALGLADAPTSGTQPYSE
jgi:hypothetical protein